MQTDDEADERLPLKALPRHQLPAVPFLSTKLATFFVRDADGQWFEQVRRAWIPVERPTH